jgi:hypothetical protein
LNPFNVLANYIKPLFEFLLMNEPLTNSFRKFANAEVIAKISYLLCGQKVTKNRRLRKKGLNFTTVR